MFPICILYVSGNMNKFLNLLNVIFIMLISIFQRFFKQNFKDRISNNFYFFRILWASFRTILLANKEDTTTILVYIV